MRQNRSWSHVLVVWVQLELRRATQGLLLVELGDARLTRRPDGPIVRLGTYSHSDFLVLRCNFLKEVFGEKGGSTTTSASFALA